MRTHIYFIDEEEAHERNSKMTNRQEIADLNKKRQETLLKRGEIAKAIKDTEAEIAEKGMNFNHNRGFFAQLGQLVTELKQVSKEAKKLTDQVMGWIDSGGLNFP